MGDRITDERLREIVANGTYCGLDEGYSIASELLAARADLREAVKLIGQAWSCKEPPEWQMEAWELLEKHRETPRG